MTDTSPPNPPAPATVTPTQTGTAAQNGTPAAPWLTPTYLGGETVTVDNCAREPIHIPGSVQPQGALLVADAHTLEVLQASRNAPQYLGHDAGVLAGQALAGLLGAAEAQRLRDALPPGSPDTLNYRTVLNLPGAGGRPHTLILSAHCTGKRLVLEFEPGQAQTVAEAQRLRNALFAMENAESLVELAQVAVRAVRDLTGFDRVMLYRFLPDDSGDVIAESKRSDLGSFLGHRFPESDIPAQARALYVRHMLRLTADVTDPQVPLEPLLDPQTGQPAQLGGAVLRATSPIHVQYLRNMGVASSLSVSIVVGDRLWGLIACHHTTGYVVPPQVRADLEYLGRVLNLQVRVKDRLDIDRFQQRLRDRFARLMTAVATTTNPLDTLSDPELELPELMSATGAVLFFEGQWTTLGQVPDHATLARLLDWIRANAEGTVWATDSLPAVWPEGLHAGAAHGTEGASPADPGPDDAPDAITAGTARAAEAEAEEPGRALLALASGVLAMSVGSGWQEGVLWLRPEIQTTVAWGGATPELAKGHLGPRTSFETYQQQVRGSSEPWHPGEIELATRLQVAMSATLGARLHVMRDLNSALQRSNDDWQRFAFVIAHDMQEPVRRINLYGDMLSSRYLSSLGERGAQVTATIMQEGQRMQSLVTDLQRYTALLGHPKLYLDQVNLGTLVGEIVGSLGPMIQAVHARVEVGPLPTLTGDRNRLQTLMQHLIQNALTFHSEQPHIQVQATPQGRTWHITVSDNGPGIPEEYHERIFGLFQRLGHRPAQGGNGAGLALARRIAELHGGTLSVQPGPMQGATFLLILPMD